jgi:Flp pilus assembly protein TadG
MHVNVARSQGSAPLGAMSRSTVDCVRGILAFIRRECGSSALEFSLAFSLLLLCVLGIMECSMALYADHFVTDAAKEATRYAMVRGSSWSTTSCPTYSSFSCVANSANVTSFVRSLAPPGINPTSVVVTTTWPGVTPTGAACDTVNGANSPTCAVDVNVQYSFNFLLPFVPWNSFNLTGYSSEVIME